MLRVLSWTIALCGACCVLPLLALADTNTTTIDEVLKRALSESILVKEIESRIATRRANGISIATLENPTLDSEVRIPTSYRNSRGSNEVAVALSQPLRASDFGVRDRVNTLIQNTATAEQQGEMLEFVQRVRLAYAKAWALERSVSQLSKFAGRAAILEKAFKRVSENGYLGAGEGHLVRAEVLKAQYQIAAIKSDLSRSRAELSKTSGFTVEGALTAPPLSSIPLYSELLTSGNELPIQLRATLAMKLANEQLKLAELDSYPKFAPRLVYERTVDYTDFVGVGITFDLPVFNRNQGERAKHKAEAGAANRLETYLSSDGFQREIQALRESLLASTNLVTGYEKEILPALQAALNAEEKLLAAGQGSLFRVWQTLRELSAAEAETVERSIKAHSDKAELAILIGKDF